MTLDSNHWFHKFRFVMTKHQGSRETYHFQNVWPEVTPLWASWYGPTVANNNYFHTKQKTHIHKFDRPNRFLYLSSFDFYFFDRARHLWDRNFASPTTKLSLEYSNHSEILRCDDYDIKTTLMHCHTTVSIRTEVYPIIAFGFSFNASLVVENHSLFYGPAILPFIVIYQQLSRKILNMYEMYVMV